MKINLHCHSNYSDGYASVLELAKKHKEQGFSAFVVTDHCYPFFIKDGEEKQRSLTSYKQFCTQHKELEKASEKLDFPCLQGIELALFGEEVLVFGQETIKKIFEYCYNSNLKESENNIQTSAHHKKLSYNLINLIKENKANTAVILCHPRLLDDTGWQQSKIFEIIDGYEFQNHGHYMFSDNSNQDKPYKWDREVPEELKPLKKFYNSDAHSLQQVNKSEGNFHLKAIKNEADLLTFIKTPDNTDYSRIYSPKRTR